MQVVENKMGTEPVNRLLLSISFPMMISMLVQALYNIVDSIFVAQINENALTAVSLAFPLQALMTAIGIGTNVGVNAMLSRSLGEKDKEKANRFANNGIFLAIIIYILFLFVGIFGTEIYYTTQTSDQAIIRYGKDYMMVVCCFSAGMYIQFAFEKLLQATGRTVYTMITQSIGAIINIILDPILIFGLFGLPRMEVVGAAVATVIGQTIAGILAIIFNIWKNNDIKIEVKGFRPDFDTIKKIYQIGLPSIFIQAVGSVMVYIMNQILLLFSTTAIAVFGVYYKLQSFVFMPVYGLNGGMVSIFSYNYGARKKSRMMEALRLSYIYAVSIMAAGFLLFQILPRQLLMLFNASPEMLSIGVPSLRIISISFIAAGFNIISISVFQSLGRGGYSMMVSLARQFIILLPVAFIMSRLGNVDYVWWSFPIAEILAIICSVVFLVRVNRDIISKMEEASE